MTRDPHPRGSVGRLLGVLVIAVLSLAGISLFAIQYHHRRADETLTHVLDAGGRLDLARRAQVGFKLQVQEWKNVLLRSPTTAEQEQRWKVFSDQEGAVAGLLNELARADGLTDEMQREAEALVTEHAQLGGQYRAAIARYVAGQPETVFAVDAQVRGIDRSLNQRIDALAEQMRTASAQQAVALRERGEHEYETLRVLVSACAALAIVVAGVLAVVALRTTRAP